MSIFAQHLRASQAGKRVAVNLRSEEEAEPTLPTDENPENAPEETPAEVTEEEGEVTPEGDVEGTDEFAEQRARLNRGRHGMIRNRMRSEEEPLEDGSEETGEAAEGEEAGETLPEGESTELDVTSEGEDGELPEEAPAEEAPAEDPIVVEDEGVDGPVEEGSEEDVLEAEEAVETDDIDEDVDAIDADEAEMEQLMGSIVALETFGSNPAAIGILQATGLLNGTALSSCGLETFQFEGPQGAETQMAVEALGEKLKAKASEWSARIVSVVSKLGSAVTGAIKGLWEKISAASKALAAGAWDKAKATGATIKAHPYATVATAVAAAAAVATIVVYAGGNLPAKGAKSEVIDKFTKSIADKINGIKWPFGSLSAKVEGAKLVLDTAGAKVTSAASAGVAKLGWTQPAVKAVSTKLTGVWDQVSQGAKAFGDRAGKMAATTKTFAKDSLNAGVAVSASANIGASASFVETGTSKGWGVAGAGYAIFATMWVGTSVALYKLVKFIVGGTFRIIAATFNALKNIVVGGAPAAA